jgi:hypothetical protein
MAEITRKEEIQTKVSPNKEKLSDAGISTADIKKRDCLESNLSKSAVEEIFLHMSVRNVKLSSDDLRKAKLLCEKL